MKELCLGFFIYVIYFCGGTLSFTWFRAMGKSSASHPSTNATRNRTAAPFDGFGTLIKEEIEKAKIKKKICEVFQELCKQSENKRPIITTPNPREISTSTTTVQPTTTSNSPNINISLVFSEPSEHSNDTNCMKFRLPEESVLSGADVFVYITNRQKRSGDKKERRRRRRKRQRKISIKVSQLDEATQSRKFISRLRFRPNRDKKWYKLVLPFSVIKKVSKSKDKSLNLCIECKRCNKKTRVILPLKTSKKRMKFIKTKNQKKKNKRVKLLKLRKKRPFLMCHTSERAVQRTRRDTLQCNKANQNSHCCRHKEYIRFADIGLGDRVAYPDGFYKTQCIGSCSYNNSSHLTTNNLPTRQCIATRYKPLQTLLVYDSTVTYLDIPNAQVEECSCQ